MDFDDPQVLVSVRIAYVAVQVLILATYYYVSYKVCGCSASREGCADADVARAD